MRILASSIAQSVDVFLHAGYLSAAATRPPPPSPEALASIRTPAIPNITLGDGDLAVLAAVAGALVVLVFLTWVWVRRVQRRLQAELDGS